MADVSRAEQQTTAQKTVTVGCKLPWGIILREFGTRKEQEQTHMGIREVEVGFATGREIRINGNAVVPNQYRLDDKGEPVRISPGGYAFTPNVPADIWDNWMHYNKDTAMVRNRMIFAAGQQREVEAMAREYEGIRSNLEPMVPATDTHPAGDPRSPARRERRGDGRALSALATATN